MEEKKKVLVVGRGAPDSLAKVEEKLKKRKVIIPQQDSHAMTFKEVIDELDGLDQKLPLKIRGFKRYWPVEKILRMEEGVIVLLIRYPSWHPKALFDTVAHLVTPAKALNTGEYILSTILPGMRSVTQIWKIESYSDKVVLIPVGQTDSNGVKNTRGYNIT